MHNFHGQLAGGQLVTVPANLIKRQKHHFNTLLDTGAQTGFSGLHLLYQCV